MLGSIGPTELLLLFLIVVLIFGASRIPEIGRGLGSGIQNFKAAMRGDAKDSEKPSDPSDANPVH